MKKFQAEYFTLPIVIVLFSKENLPAFSGE